VLLAQHLVQKIAGRGGKPVPVIGADAARKLVSYDWPGNVRELENCIERAVAMCGGDEIDPSHLPVKVINHQPARLELSTSDPATMITLDEMDMMWIPETKSWRLNERHYGGLQGLDKAETAAKYGDEQVLIWRRSYDVPPPELDETDERYLGNDPRYAGVTDFPKAECLKDTVARVVPYWETEIVPKIKTGKRLIIAAHGNSIRALVKYLDNIPDDEIVGVNIPTGVPLVYELDADLKPLKSYYLGDAEAIKAAQEAVANQGKAK